MSSFGHFRKPGRVSGRTCAARTIAIIVIAI
jgi:hypothetical protein